MYNSEGGIMNDLNTIEGFLTDVCDFLKQQKFVLSSSSDDGRVNSSLDEDIILDLMIDRYGDLIEKMPTRSWCDFKHVPSNEPINFKSTAMKGPDNACNYLALLHALTDIKFKDSRKPHSTKDKKEFLTWMRDNSLQTDYNNGRDYWFLVINKEDPSIVLFNSIKALEEAKSNPSNPPFQINWAKNKNRISRTFAQSMSFIKKTVFETLEKQYKNSSYDLMLEIKSNG
jgi:hypothetical protein